MKKRCLSFIFVLCLLFSVLAPCAFADSEFNRDALNGVAMVEVEINLRIYQDASHYEDVPYAISRGTGFFVGENGKDPQYLITNTHVIYDFLEAQKNETYFDEESGLYFDLTPTRLFVYYSDTDREEAFVVDSSENSDLSVLRLENPTEKRRALKLRVPDEEITGSSVFALGYPYASDVTVESTSSRSIGDISITNGIVSRSLTEQKTGRRLLQIDASISGGNSGGPLVDKDGNVLGINTQSSTLDSNMNYAVSTQEIIPMLKNNNIPYAEAGSFPVMYIIIAAAALAVIAVVVIIIVVVSKNKKKKAAPAVHPQPGFNPGNQGGPAMNNAAPMREPVLVSLAPQHHGREFPLSGGTVNIGRDPSCLLRFDSSTPGISSRHCSVFFQPNGEEFVLTDLGSTYGTFLSSGQRLTVGMAYKLRSGDSFYLGDNKNTIRVELRAPGQVQRQQSLQPIIRSMCPQHQGREMVVGPQPLLMGRDRSCQLVFPADTPGVSSRHATIGWDNVNSRFVLTDVGSSFGTFLSSGQKLNQGVPYTLNPGDSFILGDKNNVVRVELR